MSCAECSTGNAEEAERVPKKSTVVRKPSDSTILDQPIIKCLDIRASTLCRLTLITRLYDASRSIFGALVKANPCEDDPGASAAG